MKKVSDKSDVYWVYVLENPKGRFYTGSTRDLDQRLKQHNSAEKVGTKYTHKNGPWKLVWKEIHTSRAGAAARERQIKKMKSSKWIKENLLG